MIKYEELKSAIEALENEHGQEVDPWFLVDLAMERRVESFKRTLQACRKRKGDVSKLMEAGYSMGQLIDAFSWRRRPRIAAIVRRSQALEAEIGKERAVERYKAIIDALKKGLDEEEVIRAGLATSDQHISCAAHWYNEDLRRRQRMTETQP